jgi:hypothetical protein
MPNAEWRNSMEAALEKKTQVDEADYWQHVYDMKPATVTVTRTDPADFKQRQLVVYLDGRRLGEILFGESLTHEISPGPHRLRVSNTLVWKSLLFDVKPGEDVRFEAVNLPGRLTYPLMIILGVGPLYVTLRRVA